MGNIHYEYERKKNYNKEKKSLKLSEYLRWRVVRLKQKNTNKGLK
jgi:hypothetical protein